jgi:DNA-binding HxlR family transcriptional regulator
MRHASFAEMPCPVARTLDVIGEWWTFLIARDALLGARRFDDFKQTGIADNILSARLKRLVDEGILERVVYQAHPVRYEYVLTAKGRELALVVVARRTWGGKWTNGKDYSSLTHGDSGHVVSSKLYCGEDCGRPLTGDDDIRPSRIGFRHALTPSTASSM